MPRSPNAGDAQLSRLQALAQGSGTGLPEQLGKAVASRVIGELQGGSPLVSGS